MASRSDGTLRQLARVGALVNIAYEAEASRGLRLGAVRALQRVLRTASENDELWNQLTLYVTRPTILDNVAYSDTVAQLTDAIADLLTEHYASLLVRTGYRTPPPPPASYLVEQTRAAVAKVVSEPGAHLAEVEAAREALTKFVDEISIHIGAAEDRTLRRLLWHGRTALPALAMAYLVLGGVEIKTGDEYGIDFGTSVEHPVQVEITVPRPWIRDAVVTVAAAVAVSNLREQASARAADFEKRDFGDISVRDDPQEPEGENSRVVDEPRDPRARKHTFEPNRDPNDPQVAGWPENDAAPSDFTVQEHESYDSGDQSQDSRE